MENFLKYYSNFDLDPYYNSIKSLIEAKQAFIDKDKGNFFKFRKVVENLPSIIPSLIKLDQRAVTIGQPSDISLKDKKNILKALKKLSPWRKGPFEFFGEKVDSEWQSWMKWERLATILPVLQKKKILDIGSSNGYYMFRSAGLGADIVLGIEPQSNFYYQYLAIQKYLALKNVFCLPVAFDQLPLMQTYFDIIFCMGILYHSRSPLEMLKKIHGFLKSDGYLMVESLIIEGNKGMCLFPKDRYAKMRNIFFIPDISAMISWLQRSGFNHIKCVDITCTQIEEQRKTDWIQTESLEDFLDGKDPSKTVEGYPRPIRAIFLARTVKK